MTQRIIIDAPDNMPLGLIHKAIAESAHRYGQRIERQVMSVPKGVQFKLVPAYQREQMPRGAA